jgi:hypothetical protein
MQVTTTTTKMPLESHRNYGWILWRVRLNYPVYYPISLSSSWQSSRVRLFLFVTSTDNRVFDCGRWRNRHSRKSDTNSGKDDICAVMKNCVQRSLIMIQLSAVAAFFSAVKSQHAVWEKHIVWPMTYQGNPKQTSWRKQTILVPSWQCAFSRMVRRQAKVSCQNSTCYTTLTC